MYLFPILAGAEVLAAVLYVLVREAVSRWLPRLRRRRSTALS